MALTPEDKGDVKRAMGAKMAAKVSAITRDGKFPYAASSPHEKGGKITPKGAPHPYAAKSKALSKKSGGKKTYGNGRSDAENRRSDIAASRREIHEKYGDQKYGYLNN